jgi:hypothetical protein
MAKKSPKEPKEKLAAAIVNGYRGEAPTRKEG